MKQYHLTMLLVVLISMFGTKAFAQTIKVKNANGKTIEYRVIGSDEVEVASYQKCGNQKIKGDLVIPASVTYKGKAYRVTSIDNGAFNGAKLTSVTIPNSVTTIGEYAFSRCSSLTSATISNNLRKIDYNTFEDCSSLTSVNIPESVTSIEHKAFQGCRSLYSITIPNSVTSIGYRAFYCCFGLSSVTIPGSVTSIGWGAFDECRLKEVTIADGERTLEIHSGAFNRSVEKLYLGRNLRNGSRLFEWKEGVKFELRELVIGNNVTAIVDDAFYQCNELTEVVIPNSVTSIGKSAFWECTNLTSLVLPNNIKKIGESVFWGCKNLTSVTIPYGVTRIERTAFCKCVNLTSVTIPASVEFIGEMAFSSCESLTSVAVPKDCNVTSGTFSAFPRDMQITRYELDDYPLLADNQPVVESRPQQPAVQQPVRPQPVFNGKSDVDLNIPTSSTSNENTFAVIIGNENYQSVSKVEYAQNDAKIFAKYCQKTLGLPAKNVRSYEDATYAKLLTAVKDIQDIANAYKGDLDVIFYYAGHGIPDEDTGDAYLLPIDADGRQREVCYPLARLYSELGNMGARSVTVFLDACFSGSERGNQMLASARGVAIKAKSSAPSGKMVVFSAATDAETAYPYREKGHGLFTYFLLKKLQETKGEASLFELGSYIVDNVVKESVVSNGKSQTPTVTPSPAFGNEWQQMKLK